jgi:hypothetical protein
MTGQKKLGEMLKEEGLIDDFQLESALSHQRNWGGKLGAVLVELEFVKEEDIARVIAEKLKIPYVDLFEPELPQDVIGLVKSDTVKKYNIVPVRKEANALWIAMSDPLDIETMDNVRFITGLSVKPVIAMDAQIRDAIRKYYDGEPIVRTGKHSLRESAKRSSSLDIVREIPDIASTEHEQQQHNQQQDVLTLRREISAQKFLLDALTTLLMEKDFFTRDELAKIIEQKKMGL